MEVYIDNKHLEQLYTEGKCKKLKLPQTVVDKFFATVQKIGAATSIHDFLSDNGLRFKKMKGHKDLFSMRLNNQYRLEMRVKWENDAKTIGVFALTDISNHYGD